MRLSIVSVCFFSPLMKQELTACTFSTFGVPVYAQQHIWNNLGKIIFQRACVRISNYAVGAIFCRERSRKGRWFFFSILLRPVLQHSVIIHSKEGDRSAGNLLQHSTRWLLSVSSCQMEARTMNFEWTREHEKTCSNLKQKSRTGSGPVIVSLSVCGGLLSASCEGINLSCGDNFWLIWNIGSFEKMGTAGAAVITEA